MYRIDEHGQRVPIFGQPGADRCCATVVTLVPGARGSRRRRLWELDGHAHCPVVGVCLPAAAALRLAGKLFGDEAPTDDYARHRRLVGECKSRTATAEQVHKSLDELHAGAIRRAGASKSAEALADWWRAHSSDAGLAGTLWAVLTHPRCTPTLEERILGEVHMRQHQVGFENRADLARLRALEQANAALIAERSELQARIARQTAEHAAERQNWQAEAVRLRGHLLSRETLIALLRDEAEAARRAAPDLPSRKALALQLQAQGERLATLQRELAQAHEVAARQRATALRRESSAEVPEAAEAPPASQPVGAAASEAPLLRERTVLCVGGRTSAIPAYRDLLESLGARFVHHDGGQEQGQQRLQASLAGADLVICQAGCVSHDAYWRVKEHCKRTGKRCVFVETPSASSLRRALCTSLAGSTPQDEPGQLVPAAGPLTPTGEAR